MKNNDVYCIIGVYSCFVIILKTYFLISIWIDGATGGGVCYGMAEGCFTDIVSQTSKTYHQDHVTEPRRLIKFVLAAWCAVMLRFHAALQVISVIEHCCTLVNTNSCHVAHHIQYPVSSSAASELGKLASCGVCRTDIRYKTPITEILLNTTMFKYSPITT